MTLYKATAQGNVPMTPEEEAAFEASRVPVVQVPSSVSFRQAKTQLQLAGIWDSAITAANAITDPVAKIKMLGLLQDSAVYERSRPELVVFAKTNLGMTDAQIDSLFIEAAKL